MIFYNRDNKQNTDTFFPEPARETAQETAHRIHVNELVYQAQQCISLRGCSGRIQCHTGILGDLKVSIKLKVPKEQV